MFRDRAVQRIQQHLAFRTDKAAEIVNYLQEVQVELEHEPELPWFLKEELSMAQLTPGEQRIPVPRDFLQENEDSALFRFDGTKDLDDQWVELRKADTDTLRNVFQSTQGAPVAYYLNKDYFRLYPTPDAAYTLKMIYYKEASKLTSNIENVWLKHAAELMIGMAGQLIASDLRDGAAVQGFEKMEQKARRRLILGTVARESVNQRYVMGGPD